MKKIAKVFAMIACIATLGMMTSCGKDNEDLIIGKWQWVSMTDDNGETEVLPSGYATWEFTESGDLIWVMNYSEEQPVVKYTVKGDKITLSISGSSSDKTFTATIKSIDKNNMTIDMEEILPRHVVIDMKKI